MVFRDLNANGHFDAGENVTPYSNNGKLTANLAAGTYYLEAAGTYFARIAGVNGATNYTVSLKTN